MGRQLHECSALWSRNLDLGCKAWCTNQKASILDRTDIKHTNWLAHKWVMIAAIVHSSSAVMCWKRALELKRKEGQPPRNSQHVTGFNKTCTCSKYGFWKEVVTDQSWNKKIFYIGKKSKEHTKTTREEDLTLVTKGINTYPR